MNTIRCHINACCGTYPIEVNYQEVFQHKTEESTQDFLMTWSEQLELFIQFVVVTVLL